VKSKHVHRTHRASNILHFGGCATLRLEHIQRRSFSRCSSASAACTISALYLILCAIAILGTFRELFQGNIMHLGFLNLCSISLFLSFPYLSESVRPYAPRLPERHRGSNSANWKNTGVGDNVWRQVFGKVLQSIRDSFLG